MGGKVCLVWFKAESIVAGKAWHLDWLSWWRWEPADGHAVASDRELRARTGNRDQSLAFKTHPWWPVSAALVLKAKGSAMPSPWPQVFKYTSLREFHNSLCQMLPF